MSDSPFDPQNDIARPEIDNAIRRDFAIAGFRNVDVNIGPARATDYGVGYDVTVSALDPNGGGASIRKFTRTLVVSSAGVFAGELDFTEIAQSIWEEINT